MKEKIIMFIGLCMLLLLAACGKDGNISPNKMLSKALAEEEKVSYYGEVSFTSNMKDLNEITMKEWRDQGKSRVEVMEDGNEVIAVNDGTILQMYQEATNEVMQFSSEELQDMQISPKEQINMLLSSIEDTHEVEKLGNEEVSGRDTIHLKATAKEDGELFGDQELWIDSEHWVVLKMVMETDAYDSVMEYTKIEFNPNFEEGIFELDIPEGTTIEEIDDDSFEEEITLEEAKEILGDNFLYLTETDKYEIDRITLFALGELDSKTVNFEYKDAGTTIFTLAITSPAEDDIAEQLEVFGKDAEETQVRNEEGIYIESGMLRTLIWDEAPFQYSLYPIDPKLTLEALLEMTAKMEEIE